MATACGPAGELAGPLAQDASSIEPSDGASAPTEPNDPADASSPAHDASVPDQDASAPARDASTPVADGSVPAHDASVPIHDAAVPGGDASTGNPERDAATPAPNCVPMLVTNLRPQLDLCRTCHVQGGLAEKARYLLAETPSQDEVKVRSAFTALGRDLLNVPAQQSGRTHQAGRLITPGSAEYAAWDALLKAIADPATGCR